MVLFLPLYLAHEKGIAREQTIAIPALFAGGMLLFSNVAGRLGDCFGHLFLMRILAAIGCAMVLAFIGLGSYAPMAAAVFVAGATLASISPVSLALQGVVSQARDYDRANGIYNAFYAAGILLGPPLSSELFARFGGRGDAPSPRRAVGGVRRLLNRLRRRRPGVGSGDRGPIAPSPSRHRRAFDIPSSYAPDRT